MKKLGKLLGWLWGVSFLSYFAITLLKLYGQNLPDELESYREYFQTGLNWFLSSWLFGVVFIVGWLAFCFLWAKNSGWEDLAELYADRPSDFETPKNQFLGSGRIGKTQHNGMLRVAVSSSGVLLSVLFLFRMGHPKLFIPWKDIESVKIQRGSSDRSKKSFIGKLEAKYSPFQFANFRLEKLPDQIVITHWKNEFRDHIPPELIIS